MDKKQAIKIVVKDKEERGREPVKIFWDIETSPILGYAWGMFETNIIKVKEYTKIISVSWMKEGEKHAHVKALPDFPGYKPGVVDDKHLIRLIWDIMDEADILIAQNGDKFDVKTAQARMLAHGITPPSPPIQIDTLKIARRYFNLPAYNLDEMLRYVGLPGKVSTGGKELWFNCMEGDPKAWAKMKEYNKNDVEIMPPLYNKMRGWHKTHPSVTNFTRKQLACPVCNAGKLTKRGTCPLVGGYKIRYQCSECGRWSVGELIKNDVKITIK